MLSHFSQLTDHMLQKGEEYLGQVQDLTDMGREKEEELLG